MHYITINCVLPMHLKKCRSSYTPYDHPVAPDFCSFSFLRTCSVSLICGLTAFIHFPRISVAPWPEEPGGEWHPLLSRPVGKLVMLSEFSWSSIPAYTQARRVLVRKKCYEKVVDRVGGGIN